MEQYITLLSRRIPELMVSLCFWTTYCYCFLSDFFHERIYLLVQGDNKQVSEELEAFRKLASNLKASPPNQPGAVDER
jgi:hypothetical protein